MEYNRFTARIIILVILISLTGILFIWALGQDYLLVAKFSTGILWISMIILLISYVNRTNKTLNSFLQSIRNMDSSRAVEKDDSGTHKQLNITYNEIIDIIQGVKVSKEENYQYFRSLADVSGTGMFVFDEDGNIDLINRTAREIFGIDTIGKFDSVDKYATGFSSFCMKLEAGSNKLFRSVIKGELVSLATRKSLLRKGSVNMSLITVQNIHGVIEDEELIVWQKLINVLTHEIMNSVSPIKSLSGTLGKRLRKSGSVTKYDREELIEGLEAIDRRSNGLMKFVDSYQKLTKIPEPVFEDTNIKDLLRQIKSLFGEKEHAGQISLSVSCQPEGLKSCIDPDLISQVLINLVQNATYAVSETEIKRIEISATRSQIGKTVIEVKDTGKGISPDIMDKIFIPFFTTRENGSGIGLSLTKQIISMHNGSIKVKSEPGFETVFTIVFN
jgi:nitrogen fixation/metabolism regulation signal transduction histidine kinase